MVIRFDLFPTLISYVQSRGRARHPNSKYIIFLERDNQKQIRLLEQVREYEDQVNYWRRLRCLNLVNEETGEMPLSFDDDDLGDDIVAPEWNEWFIAESTGASISYNSSISVLHHYCACLPNDGFVFTQPEYNIRTDPSELFVVTIKMPSNCPLKQAESKPLPRKKLAKKSAAFNAVRELYKLGAFDEHILPRKDETEKDWGERQKNSVEHLLEGMFLDATDLSGAQKKVQKDRIWEPKQPWHQGEWPSDNQSTYKIYLHSFESAKASMIWGSDGITMQLALPYQLPELPAFPLYFPLDAADAQYEEVSIQFSFARELDVSAEEFFKLRRLNTLIMRYVFLRNRDFMDDDARISNSPEYIWEKVDYSQHPEDYAFHLVPCLSDGSIDWDTVELTFRFEEQFQELEDPDVITVMERLGMKDQPSQFIGTDIVDYQKRFIISSIEDTTPESPITKEDREAVPDLKASVNTYMDMYRGSFKRIPYTKKKLPRVRIEQPMVTVTRAPPLRNYLRPPVGNMIDDTKPYIASRARAKLSSRHIPQFLIFCPIPALMYRAITVIPSLISRVESLYAVFAFRRDHHFPEIPQYLLLEALTAPSANTGYSYERLETLGDGFLKAGVGLYLYMSHPEKHEGQLSYTRHLIVSNAALYHRGASCRLPEYIYTRPIAPKAWRIPFQGKPDQVWGITGVSKMMHANPSAIADAIGEKTTTISDSTVADGVEALLGAALLCGGVPLALKMAHFFGITIGEGCCWNTAYVPQLPKVHPRMHEPEEKVLELLATERVEQVIGYKFRYPAVLVEAMSHASAQNSIACYQRLEYLGDAILDFLIIRRLFQINHDNHNYVNFFPKFIPSLTGLPAAVRAQFREADLPLDPGRLTDMKMLIVNNDTLAFVSAAIGLGKHAIFFSDPLMKSSGRFIEFAAETMESNGENATMMTYMPWWWWRSPSYSQHNKEQQSLLPDFDNAMNMIQTKLEDVANLSEYDSDSDMDVDETDMKLDSKVDTPTPPAIANVKSLIPEEQWDQFLPSNFLSEPPATPKMLSDIVESVVGAVFVDSHLDLEQTWEVIDRCLQISGRFGEEAVDTEMEDLSTPNGVGFERWLSEDSYDALCFRLHPLRKLMEWSSSKQCQKLEFK